MKEECWKDLKSSECDAWTIYLQRLECCVSVILVLMMCWMAPVEIAAPRNSRSELKLTVLNYLIMDPGHLAISTGLFYLEKEKDGVRENERDC